MFKRNVSVRSAYVTAVSVGALLLLPDIMELNLDRYG